MLDSVCIDYLCGRKTDQVPEGKTKGMLRFTKQRNRSDNDFAKHEMRSTDLLDERTSMTYNFC